MKELVGIILLTVLVVFGSCNSNTNVSLVGTSPQLFDVCQVSTGNPDYRNKELFINELKRKCKYPIKFQKNKTYISAPWGTPDWQDYWETQLDRCINGYSVFEEDGTEHKITGHHYFYLNYSYLYCL